ncbi:MAG: sugar phosphate isomerase/epimerase [Bacteroidales bacterium]|nr:sugar phosphate isomerase/epimerase [Bacteroidales bacterium]
MSSSNSIKRRDFIRNTAVGAAAIGLGTSAIPSLVIPDKANAKPKVGLYSISYLGVWYSGKALTLDEMIVRSKKLGFDGIEIDGKRPHGNPLDMPAKRCKELKAKAEDQDQEIFAVSANNDFSSPIPEHRECQIVYVRDLIRMTSDLGVKPLRVFLGWPGVTLHPGRYDIAHDIWQHTHYQFTAEETWNWCREGLIECSKYAGDYGVTLALQNHKPVINDWRDVMRMVEEVDSPNLKVCLDAPIMDDKSAENINAAAKAVGPLQVLTHFGGEFGRDKDGKVIDIQEYKKERDTDGNIIREEFYPQFVQAMSDIGYTGYFSYELCHPLPVVNGQTVGIDFVDQCAGLGCEMMKGLINQNR